MAKILVIEDNPANMKLATLLLRNVGHTVLCAVDAESGLIMASNLQPDLILMDIQLPGMDGLAATALLKKDPVTVAIPVIALTAMAMKDDQEKTKAAGCDAYIAKPLRYQEFYKVINLLLAERESKTVEVLNPCFQLPTLINAQEELSNATAQVQQQKNGSRILVAEDSLLNQKLILRQLALLGFDADIADNGQIALQRWQHGSYSLLLCDLQMPEMDGFELTKAIRAQEKGLCRIPIIALSASILTEVSEHYRLAGMDDYLNKPLQLAELKTVLEKWLPIKLEVHNAIEDNNACTLPVDVTVLENLVGNDPAVILEFQNDFQVSAKKIALQLISACVEHQPIRAGEQAHKLMSSARAVGALALGELCAQIETAGKAGDTDMLTTLLPLFEIQLNTVTTFLTSLQIQPAENGLATIDAVSSSIRILVLDDEPFMYKLLAHMLTDLGFTSITTCDNGLMALECVDATISAPNLILLDLNMPGMDGIEFVRKLVEHHYTGSLVLISGEDERILQMTEKLIQAHQITVLGHIKKPVSRAALAEVVNKWQPTQQPLRTSKKIYRADELRSAMINDELVNYYQPKVEVATGKFVGVETLVRWCHPVDGLILPEQFIGVAEQNGLIDELTRIVLIRAMAQAKQWQQAGLQLRVAINISMENLCSVTFADFVAAEVTSAGLTPQDIILEVTESCLLIDQRIALETLTRLRLKRFCLSIDDFGTGYSSLTQLNDIPFDELKIDRSFVHDAWRDETAMAMYNTSLGLGKQLGMEVVAEGVEDSNDWDLITRTGCDLAQGYFIAQPMPAANLMDWLNLWNKRAINIK
jgi:CheY-like chemotaxis protein/HPt (histidine-containing phosphotransfer) domain-containing protein